MNNNHIKDIARQEILRDKIEQEKFENENRIMRQNANFQIYKTLNVIDTEGYMIDKLSVFLFIISVCSCFYGLATNKVNFMIFAIILFLIEVIRNYNRN